MEPTQSKKEVSSNRYWQTPNPVTGPSNQVIPSAFQDDLQSGAIEINFITNTYEKVKCDFKDLISPQTYTLESFQYKVRSTSSQKSIFYLCAVPTSPTNEISQIRKFVRNATLLVGSLLAPGDLVIFESAIFPGFIEDYCLPLLEQASNLSGNNDFGFGYTYLQEHYISSHNHLRKPIRIVAGGNDCTSSTLAQFFSFYTKNEVFIAPSIKSAESTQIAQYTYSQISQILTYKMKHTS